MKIDRPDLFIGIDFKALSEGKLFAKTNRFKDIDEKIFNGKSSSFQLGAQSAWRRSGELPNMMALDLEPGDHFTVDPPDAECPIRICLTSYYDKNDKIKGIRFTFPNKPEYWCFMGELVEVKLVDK